MKIVALQAHGGRMMIRSEDGRVVWLATRRPYRINGVPMTPIEFRRRFRRECRRLRKAGDEMEPFEDGGLLFPPLRPKRRRRP